LSDFDKICMVLIKTELNVVLCTGSNLEISIIFFKAQFLNIQDLNTNYYHYIVFLTLKIQIFVFLTFKIQIFVFLLDFQNSNFCV
jgi:hypothetical protein